jgi:hypothetical protein
VRPGSFASLRTVLPDRKRMYVLPMKLRLNEWALAGDWHMNDDSSVLNVAHGKLAYRFHARDVRLSMGAKTRGPGVAFRVTIDGKPPGAAHGVDVNADGFGLLGAKRPYQLIGQDGANEHRQVEIEFLDSGAEVFVFTFR